MSRSPPVPPGRTPRAPMPSRWHPPRRWPPDPRTGRRRRWAPRPLRRLASVPPHSNEKVAGTGDVADTGDVVEAAGQRPAAAAWEVEGGSPGGHSAHGEEPPGMDGQGSIAGRSECPLRPKYFRLSLRNRAARARFPRTDPCHRSAASRTAAVERRQTARTWPGRLVSPTPPTRRRRPHRSSPPRASGYRRAEKPARIGPPRSAACAPRGSRRGEVRARAVHGASPKRTRVQGMRPAAMVAPRFQQASASALPGSPATATLAADFSQPRPVVMDSMPRTAPVVSLLPCTYSP